MNLLDSVLCTSNAQKYSPNFKKFSIDAFTLKLLNDEDLKILGIDEEDVRSLILKHAANLQIPAEKQTSVVVDHKYMQLVIAQMSVHLTKHLAALSIALNRQDTIICNVRLSKATGCLHECVGSLETQLNQFEEKVMVKPKKRSAYNRHILSTMLATTIVYASFKAYKHFLRLS